MTFNDQRGLAMTAAQPAAVTAFDAAVASLLEYRLDLPAHLNACLAADPACVLGHCFKGYTLLLAFTGPARQDAEAALRAAEAAPANPREKLHRAALRAWWEGDRARAGTLWETLLAEYPTDMLALRVHHFNTFWRGQSYRIRDTIAQVLPAWDERLPGYGSLLGMFAFGLEECGDYARAETVSRRAVELGPDDLWSVHAVAHVLESQGRQREGVAWLEPYTPERLAARGTLKGHLWWHQTLYWLDLGEFDAALDTYDNRIRAVPSAVFTDMQNAVALLMRLELQGVDVGDRWQALAADCAGWMNDYLLSFTHSHVMLALARADRSAARRLLEVLENRARSDTAYYDKVVLREVGLPLCRALLAFGEGAYERATDGLLALRENLSRIGGSHAQRDLYQQLLAASALRAGRLVQARALYGERMSLRPHSLTARRQYEQVLHRLTATPEAVGW